jgi:hypothetical protein
LIGLDDLDSDPFASTEANLHLRLLASGFALRLCYMEICPDQAACEVVEKSIFHADRSAKRAFGSNEYEEILRRAMASARKAVDSQKLMMQSEG